MFNLPDTLAVPILASITFLFESSKLLWPKGSSESPKSNVSSVGITGDFNASGPIVPETCRLAARLAAFALAIWSRNAEDDLREDDGGSSRELTVGAVEVVDGLDRLRPSPDVLDDWAEAREPFRTEADDRFEVDWTSFKDGIDGLVNKPLIDARAFRGRAVRVLDPNLDTETAECFSGLGVRGPIEADREAREDMLPREGRLASFGVLFVARVLEPKVETRLDGVPRTVGSGGLYEFVEALKFPYPLSKELELEPGRLRGPFERPFDPSD